MRSKNLFFFLILCLIYTSATSQVPGDTIVINTFTYGSTTRDTVIPFPNNPLIQYEKVLMQYNMRCKDGLVSPAVAGQTNIGCGEWDYSCNTYITDSTRVDSLLSTRASHTISNFTGTTYPFTNIPYYHRYQYPQITTSTSIVSENQYIVGNGTLTLQHTLDASQKSSRAQYLFTQAELLAAGVTAGNIDGFLLSAFNSANVNFLSIKLKHTIANSLDNTSPDLSGFTETYSSNTAFTMGTNRLQFNTPFLWDGVSNILIDFSCTNSTPTLALQLSGTNVGSTYGLYATNNYHINTSSGVTTTLSPAPFSSINNQITVSYWCKGNTGVSTRNTSIVEGVDNNMRRQLNIHMPWSNGRIYFDCGNLGSGYDRIDKQATLAELEQNWNHWAFTKNASTGIMNIYLNGVLWHTGTGKTHPINIDSIMLGANINQSNLFHGDIDEFTVWNAELSAVDIQNWMRKTIDATHPNYTNLVAYYRLNEGTGNTSIDESVNAQLTNFGTLPAWKYMRGHELNRFFTNTTERPNITFLQGVYTLTNTTVMVLDSVLALTNVVKAYAVTSNAGTSINDSYNIISTNQYYLATYRYLYDGMTGVAIDSFAVAPIGNVVITNLNFMERYPSKYEIMSFVTPYGINLDMGMSGKTWTFDMTDYLPILKGNRRLSIERGGEWQENMDIKFLFIVGTPVRDVKDITQVWRQPGSCNYAQIMADTYFEPRTLAMNPSGKYFKMRTMITGHGQEGEFIPRRHAINIGGGTNEYEWLLVKKCARNPLYPQGGTWIYDRCGWCPGMASDLIESDLTPFVTAGQPAIVDYHMLPLAVGDPAIGSSFYLVTNQLVTYGDYNFTLDASIIDILAPTNKIEHAREQAICASPSVRIQNTGSTPLTSLRIEYWINNNTNKKVMNWSGNLAPLESTVVTLSNIGLWENITTPENQFHVEISNPNGAADQYSFNNQMTSQFVITDVVPTTFIIYLKTNSAASETSYQLTDESGNILLNKTGLANNTIYRDTLTLPYGCYKFEAFDSDEDGLSFFANSDGAGILRFLKSNGGNFKTFVPDYGAGVVYNFTIGFPLSYEELFEQDHISIYPNPANNQVTIEGVNLSTANISVRNSVGQLLQLPSINQLDKRIYNTSSLSRGIYFVNISLKEKTLTKKLVIE